MNLDEAYIGGLNLWGCRSARWYISQARGAACIGYADPGAGSR